MTDKLSSITRSGPYAVPHDNGSKGGLWAAFDEGMRTSNIQTMIAVISMRSTPGAVTDTCILGLPWLITTIQIHI